MMRTWIVYAATVAASLAVGCAGPQEVAGDAETARGAEVFATYCTDTCHQTPRPDSLTVGQWRAVMQTMQARIREQGQDPIPADDYDALLAYLAAHARR